VGAQRHVKHENKTKRYPLTLMHRSRKLSLTARRKELRTTPEQTHGEIEANVVGLENYLVRKAITRAVSSPSL